MDKSARKTVSQARSQNPYLLAFAEAGALVGTKAAAAAAAAAAVGGCVVGVVELAAGALLVSGPEEEKSRARALS